MTTSTHEPAAPAIPTADHASLDWLADPTVFAVNRLPAHSAHHYYEDNPQAGEPSSLIRSLDGTWRVRVVDLADHDADLEGLEEGATPAFAAEGFDDAGYTPIDIPSNLETAGLMGHQYVNQQYPWSGHESPAAPAIPTHNHVALHRLAFHADATETAALTGGARQAVTLTFHGASTAIMVWLNGTFVGYAEDSFTPSEFDVTDTLRPGANTLAVACFEHASASWLEDQDFWRLHGLFRTVEIATHPAVHVADLAADADFDTATGEGVLDLSVALEGARDAVAGASVEAELTDEDDVVLWHGVLDADADAEDAGPARLRAHAEIAHVRPWSAEDPNLHTLALCVRDANGAIVEVATQRIGFRHFAIEGGVMRLNGKRIVFKGVNRHEFDARTGRVISEETMEHDIRFFKRHNINAVRTSHYPNQTRWYELCDEHGIYVIDETNIETHGTWTGPGDHLTPDIAVPGDKPEWRDACIDRANSMLRRDRNHPSVLIWSLGNESYAGKVQEEMTDFLHAADPTRPVHYEGVFWNRAYEHISDVESRMYAKPAEIEEYLASNPAKPYISCEYSHSMGNSTGGLHLYTELERHEQYQGGFIWDYVDQALWQRLPDGTERLAYGGDFDDRPTDYEFSGDGIAYADRTPTPKAQEVKQLYANVRLAVDPAGVTVRNGNLFVSTAGSLFTARVLVDGVERWHADHRFIVDAGEERHEAIAFPGVDTLVPAGERAEVTWEVDQRLGYDAWWAPAGFELTFGQHTQVVDRRGEGEGAGEGPVAGAAPAAFESASAAPASEAQAAGVPVGEGEWKAGRALIAADRFNAGISTAWGGAILSRSQGGLVSLRRDGREMVVRRPALTTFRPLTDNDRGNASGFERAEWFGAGRYARVTGTEVTRGEAGLTALYTYELADRAHTPVAVRYTVDDALRVRLTVSYPGGVDAATLPAFGVEWMLPAQYDRLAFYGLGPEETYRDRLHGAKLGVFHRTAAEDCAPYLVPQETGNHEGVRWAEVTDADGHGLRVSGVDGGRFAASLLPYSTLMLEEATHADELPPVRHTFLRLLAGQMGVGGDDTWGAPVHDEFQLPSADPLTLDVTIDLI